MNANQTKTLSTSTLIILLSGTFGKVQDSGIFIWEGLSQQTNLGYSVSDAGDFDTDGYSDIMLSNQSGGNAPYQAPSGKVKIYSGLDQRGGRA
jgi:hypothetical protein